MVAIVPLAYVVERFVIRRLYGESVDYTIIATYAMLLIAVNAIKRIWGVAPFSLPTRSASSSTSATPRFPYTASRSSYWPCCCSWV